MRKIYFSLYVMFLLSTISLKAQWIVTPSSPISSYSQPVWYTGVDLNDKYTVMVYGNQNPSTSPGGTGVFMKIFDSSNTPITSDISVFNMGITPAKVRISNNNDIYVLGEQTVSSTTQLWLKKFNASGALLTYKVISTTYIEFFDLETTDNGDVIVSIFTPASQNTPTDLKLLGFDSNLNSKGTLNVASGITNYNLPTANLRSHFIDYNNGSFIVGYSSGYDSSLTATIKKYTYNTSSITSSALTNTYNFNGGFRRTVYRHNSHQVSLRSNGDVFYVNAMSGVYRISGGTTTQIYNQATSKIAVDKSDNILITWVDSTSAKARLYSSSNTFIHYYQEDGYINGQWDAAIYNCKFVIIGDKSNLGTDYHTNRNPHYQFFNCSSCTAGGPAVANASFRYPNQVVQVSSLYGPLDVTELCLVDDLLVDGSASCNEDGYFVELSEFNPMAWSEIVLYSDWVYPLTQAPNNINIVSFLPNGYHLRPGKIYKFKLAVGSPWDSVDIFFKVNCCERDIILDPLPEDPIKFKMTEDTSSPLDSGEKVTIFPNPTQEKITIDLEQLLKEENQITVKIYTNLGKEIYNTSTKDKKITINSNKWSKGYYICKIFTSKEIITKKIIKE
ncbi:T9SS type A sorting domain-containing protein [Flavobacterium sp. NRK F10]|uniref:T9SS type A sorting domain-containing protein n=1 Tax=Flavobacterium sp. NRK F10 TaxID=2954931 RepID=UPI0020919BD0|nr:T9SS type A sorting domain-containing protein [Flavobacterium sp. NRK F10]MCO6173878.1 T9SS type A sorting domain-containing protein [Flavobacterium sp. NRK F10]